MTPEQIRLEEARAKKAPWKMWGPYLSERQWGTVREDYSESGNAWDYFSHDQARSRAYRWGEDGLAGFSDDQQRLCFALALWNGKDPILKERLFGLTNSESNHGEDVKEYYFYLDSTPTHSYMKYLYKYPQAAFPYDKLVETSRGRSRSEFEYELLDTGVFEQDRYFDVFVEYAKESPEDVLIQVRIFNRGPEPAAIHVLPTLWFRNEWSGEGGQPRPTLEPFAGGDEACVVRAVDPQLGERYLYCEENAPLLFTENETNTQRICRNVFEGGFLGLDNIGVFDRSALLPTGGYLEQADGTAWMALYCQNMLEIAVELAISDPDYADMALKFCEHYLWIASSMAHLGEDTGMWDEEDGFFYDVLRLPDGTAQRLKVRSMVGLLPLCATTAFDGEVLAKYPELGERLRRFLSTRPEIRAAIHDPLKVGQGGRRMTAILDETKLRRVLTKMLDENEFLSPFGIRSLSRYHADHPYVMQAGGQEYRVGYLPAESDTGMFGGNSNWRGPVWMPVNALIIRALLQYYSYYGNTFTIECPTGSGKQMNLYEVGEEIARRGASIFLRDREGRRPVYGGSQKFQQDPHWRDLLLFYEYFHGDNGAGLGASHQTGWTGIIARAMHLFATSTAEQVLEFGKLAPIVEIEPARALVGGH